MFGLLDITWRDVVFDFVALGGMVSLFCILASLFPVVTSLVCQGAACLAGSLGWGLPCCNSWSCHLAWLELSGSPWLTWRYLAYCSSFRLSALSSNWPLAYWILDHLTLQKSAKWFVQRPYGNTTGSQFTCLPILTLRISMLGSHLYHME